MTSRFAEREPSLDFILDLNAPEFVENPYPTFRWLREQAPAYRMSKGDAVVFSRYRDVKAIFDDRRFSGDARLWEHARPERWPPEHAAFYELLDRGLLRLEEGDHLRVRELVSAAFTPKNIETMRSDVAQIAEGALRSSVKDARLDVCAFASQIPLRTLHDLLRVPEALRAEFFAFAQATIQCRMPGLPHEELAAIMLAMPRWIAQLRDLVSERDKNRLPNDFLSTILDARDRGESLSEDETVSLVHTLITAGTDTVVNALCFAISTLVRHPDALREVREDPALLRSAVDEALRYDSFLKSGLPKFCREEMEFSGVRLRRGQMVYPLIPAALHDPEVFPEPERFDVRRTLTHPIFFGSGAHFCLGAHLARMEIEIAVSTLLRHFPRPRLVEGPTFAPHFFMRPIAILALAQG